MAATQTVYQLSPSRDSNETIPTIQATEILTPQHGVVTLFGYGTAVRVDRGHLILEDGIGLARRQGRFPRVGHGLQRLVVISSDGMVSLAALRWLADQGVAFVMLERNGKVLAVTGPVRPSDARLRRAQALAHQSGVALRIARELIDQKLAGQRRLTGEKLRDSIAAEKIAEARAAAFVQHCEGVVRLAKLTKLLVSLGDPEYYPLLASLKRLASAVQLRPAAPFMRPYGRKSQRLYETPDGRGLAVAERNPEEGHPQSGA